MKMVKKILLGLVTGALVLGFVGCKPPEAGNSDMISVSGSKGSISYTNESDTQVSRGFSPMRTKHLDAICHIQMTKKDLVGEQVANGVMGYVFNLVENDEAETKSFSVAAIRYNQKKGLSAYVETFRDIPNADIETTSLSGSVATGLGTYDDGVIGKIIADKTIVENKLKDGVLDVWIEVVANGKAKKTVDGETTWVTPKGRDGGAEGTYTVYFFLEDPKRKKVDSANNYDLTYNGADTRPADIGHATVAADDVFMKYDSTKGLTSMQSYMGCYANVYKEQTLEGTWEFLEIKKEAEEIE